MAKKIKKTSGLNVEPSEKGRVKIIFLKDTVKNWFSKMTESLTSAVTKRSLTTSGKKKNITYLKKQHNYFYVINFIFQGNVSKHFILHHSF